MALDKSQLVRVYTGRLVRSLVPAEFGEEFVQSITSDLLASMAKTVSTSSSSSSRTTATIHELNQLTNQYRVFFVSNGLQAEWIRFQTILESLQSFKSLDQIHNYLVFFDTLQQGSSNSNAVSTPPGTHRAETEGIRTTNLRSSPLQESSKSRSQHQPQPQHQHQHQHQHQQPLSQPQHTFNHQNHITSLDKLIEPYYQTLSEQTIMKYLSYSLIGLDSKLLSFTHNNRQIVLPTSINNSYSGLLFQILECGLLYKNLSNNYDIYNKQSDQLKSPIKVAYIQVMQSYLLQYVKEINDVFNINNYSSLLEIYNFLYKNWVYELRLLNSIINELDNVNGLDLLIKIYELTKFGDFKIQNLSLTIFKEIIKPYNEILENWLINGELVDLNNEFFITFDLDQDEFNDIIKFLPHRIPKFINQSLGLKIYQIGKMLIFLLKYCRELEWINQYRHKYNQLISKLALPTDGEILSISNNKFQALINQQYEELLNYVTIILHGSKNNLVENLINFKRFYFIESEDFINQIILKGGEFFNNLKFNLNLNYLSQILEESIKNSSVKHFKHRDRIDFRILNNQSNGDNGNDKNSTNIGWEVFIIDYKLDGISIGHLFDSKIMIQYCKMFNFLWKLRHLQSMLNENFIESININKNELRGIQQEYKQLKKSTNNSLSLSVRDRKIMWIIKSFNSVNLIRNKMIQFLNIIINYLSFDVIEQKFQIELIEKLFKSNKIAKSSDYDLVKNLNSKFIHKLINHSRNDNNTIIIENNMNELTIDEMLSIHEQYLYQIIKHKLINENSTGKITRKSYIKQIYDVLDVIFQFIISSREYDNLIINYVLLLKLEEQEPQDNDSGTNEVELIDQDLLNVENLLQNIINKIYKQIYLKDYKLMVNELVQDLRTDYELKDLSRLF